MEHDSFIYESDNRHVLPAIGGPFSYCAAMSMYSFTVWSGALSWGYTSSHPSGPRQSQAIPVRVEQYPLRLDSHGTIGPAVSAFLWELWVSCECGGHLCFLALPSVFEWSSKRHSTRWLPWVQDGPKIVPSRRKTIPRWAQNESMESQNDLRCSQDCPKMMQESRHMACTQPKADQDASFALHRQWTLARSIAKS